MSILKKKDASDSPKAAATPVSGAEDVRKKVSRLGIATAACAVVAAGAVGFAAIDHMNSTNKLNQITSNMTEVVVAVEKVGAGTTLTSDMLTTISVPNTYVSAGAVASPDVLVGHKAIVDIEANTQVRASEVAGSGEGSHLAALIEDGEKAVTIDTSSSSAYAQRLLHQGDRCTLYAFADPTTTVTISASGKDTVSATGNTHKQKIVLARDAKILALDGFTSYADMKAANVDTYSAVTFQVSAKEAERIRELQDTGVVIWPIITAASDVEQKTAADELTTSADMN